MCEFNLSTIVAFLFRGNFYENVILQKVVPGLEEQFFLSVCSSTGMGDGYGAEAKGHLPYIDSLGSSVLIFVDTLNFST